MNKSKILNLRYVDGEPTCDLHLTNGEAHTGLSKSMVENKLGYAIDVLRNGHFADYNDKCLEEALRND